MSTINLSKNDTINLSKAAEVSAPTIRFGINWGQIKSGFFGGKTDVDLDATAVAFTKSGNVLGEVSYRRLSNSFMVHSGDDLTGDAEADDDDNETITMDFDKAGGNVDSVVLFVNSFSGVNFDKIPYAGIRLYEGDVNSPSKVHAKFDIANDSDFKGAQTMILGSMSREEDGDWQFKAVGETVQGINRIDATVQHIQNTYF